MPPNSKLLKTPINININETNDSEENNSINDYIEFKEYIIKNNIVLQSENKKLALKIVELEALILQHENEEDKYDNRVRYMKGLLNNMNELKNLYNNLSKSNELITNQHNSYEKNIYKKLKILFLKIIGYNLLFILSNIFVKILSFWYNNYLYIIIIPTNIFLISSLYFVFNYYYYLLNENNKNHTKIINGEKLKIKKFKEEAKSLEDSTLTLDNWICEI